MVKLNRENQESALPILVVHDNPLMSSSLARNRSDRWTITELPSLADAIRTLNSQPHFGLVLISMQMARFQSQSTSCIGCKFANDARIIFLDDVIDDIGFSHIRRSHCTIASPDPAGWNAIFEILFNGIMPVDAAAPISPSRTSHAPSSDGNFAPTAQSSLQPRLSSMRLSRHRRPQARTNAADSVQQLTPRQLQVLKLIRHGLSNRDIAAHLNLSEGTVKLHNTGIFKSLGVRNRTEAALEAAKWL